MEKSGPICYARRDFQKFVRGYSTPLRGDGYPYLSAWLEAWLEYGLGLERTGHNFETYLRVSLDIADAAMRGEINWTYDGTLENGFKDSYEREGIVGLHDPDADGAYYADRANYEVKLVQWEQEQQRERLTGEAVEQ